MSLISYSCNQDNSESIYDEINQVNSTFDNLESQDLSVQLSLSCPSFDGEYCPAPSTIETYILDEPVSDMNWEIEGNASIIGGQGTTEVRVVFSNNWQGGYLTLSGTNNGLRCINKQQLAKCQGTIDPCAGLSLGILDEYIDGTIGGNEVFLLAGGNFPSGTTYTWVIKRENGHTDLYGASTENPRRMLASQSNKIVSAQVTANYNGCTKTSINNFNNPIPNTEVDFGFGW